MIFCLLPSLFSRVLQGKLPNAVTGAEYFKEYQGANAQGGDELCISRTAVKAGARALVIDDLVATGGTLIAACDLLAAVGAVVRPNKHLKHCFPNSPSLQQLVNYYFLICA